ncbi:MAG: hypothetical protein ABIH72_02265 [archaeon]
MEKKSKLITREDLFVYPSSTTSFPDMWIYFLTDYENHHGGGEDYVSRAITLSSAWMEKKKIITNFHKEILDTIGEKKIIPEKDDPLIYFNLFNHLKHNLLGSLLNHRDYEVWEKTASGSLYFYLATRNSLLFLDEISTPKREKGFELFNHEDFEKELEERDKKASNHIENLVVNLENNRLDKNSLHWVYTEGFDFDNHKTDLWYWEKRAVAKKLEAGAKLIGNSCHDIDIDFRNIDDSERLMRIAKEVLDISKGLAEKGKDPDYSKKLLARSERELEGAKANLDADPENSKLRKIYELINQIHISLLEDI